MSLPHAFKKMRRPSALVEAFFADRNEDSMPGVIGNEGRLAPVMSFNPSRGGSEAHGVCVRESEPESVEIRTSSDEQETRHDDVH
jgi:hypothetical protein